LLRIEANSQGPERTQDGKTGKSSQLLTKRKPTQTQKSRHYQWRQKFADLLSHYTQKDAPKQLLPVIGNLKRWREENEFKSVRSLPVLNEVRYSPA
jgi:hypothetical protein